MSGRSDRIALIGFGAIGRSVAEDLVGATGGEGPILSAVLVRPGNLHSARAALPERVAVVAELGELLATKPSLVVECAGQEAVRSCAKAALASGSDLMLVSTGALAEPGLLDTLAAVAEGSGARLFIPAGAIAGLDGLSALKLCGLESVTYTSVKPPLAWRDTPAEKLLDLDSLRERTVFFEGPARKAALDYPRNANLAATVALAGLGLDRTRVRLVADPSSTGNTGMIEAESAGASLKVILSGAASANPKTSASTAYSLVHAIRTRTSTVVI